MKKDHFQLLFLPFFTIMGLTIWAHQEKNETYEDVIKVENSLPLRDVSTTQENLKMSKKL